MNLPIEQRPATQHRRFERRWPVAVVILAAVFLLALMPKSLRLMPIWVTYVIGTIMLAPIAAVGFTSATERWRRVERLSTMVVVVATVILLILNLANLIHTMATRANQVTGTELLASSVGFWFTNVLVFSLTYWQLDRGGPEARINGPTKRTDWLFPQTSAPASDIPPDWKPSFVDYLYLAFSTATAFSTTEVAPLTSRAKLLMMLESTLSLVIIVVVLARAINIFGS